MAKPATSRSPRFVAALAALGCALACAHLPGGGPDPATATQAGASLEAASRRWQGTRARLALPLEVSKSAGEWTSSGPVYVAKAEGGGREFYFQFLVEGRPTLDAVFEGQQLRAETPFVAEGWRFKDPESSKGPYLELRFADLPARARVEFRGVRQFDFDDFPLSRLEEVEEYCRQTLFKVAAAASPASPAPPAPAAVRPTAAPPAAAPAPPSPQPRPASERATLALVRVAVNPTTVPRGGDAELVVVYSVGGIPSGGTLEVLERREVLRGGDLILSTEDRHERPAATFTSAKPLRFSLDAGPGAYLLRVTLEGGGSRVEGTANFEIR
jgi:hypothetical protein